MTRNADPAGIDTEQRAAGAWDPTQRRKRGSVSTEGKLLDDENLPADVFVPAHPVVFSEEDVAVSVELFDIPNFGVMAVAFSSEELLVARLGTAQPWALFDTAEFESLLADLELDIEGVLYDPGPGLVASVWTDELVREYEIRLGNGADDGEA